MSIELYNVYWSDVEQRPYIVYKGKTLFFSMHPVNTEKLCEVVKNE